jgi:lipoate-protein ligase A
MAGTVPSEELSLRRKAGEDGSLSALILATRSISNSLPDRFLLQKRYSSLFGSQMKYLDLSLKQPEANLACDETLLEWCEEGGGAPLLRFWESPEVFVVVGYSKPVANEVHLQACEVRGFSVLRRCTGGGTVVQGPGCLNYALVLPVKATEALQTIPATNRYVMEKHCQIVQSLLGTPVAVQGYTDLTVQGRKFSGNAQRRRRDFLLFHGSFLLGFDLKLIEELLPLPAAQPEYRAGRSHHDFLINVPVDPALLKNALRQGWDASEPLEAWPKAAVERLALDRYGTSSWNRKF